VAAGCSSAAWTTRWAALGLTVGDLIMARRQLLNLKQLAENHHRSTPLEQATSEE
jgi:hypothetical protein